MELKYLWDVFLNRITTTEAKQITELGTYRLWFGQHRGRSLDAVWDNDPSYLSWFLKQKTTTCKMTQQRVRTYLKIRAKIQPENFTPELITILEKRK